MTKAQLAKLIELMDAKLSEYHARDSSDGGLIESIRISEITKELLELCND